MTQVNLRLRAELVEDLEQLANERGIRMTRLCAEELEALVEREQAKLAEIWRREEQKAAKRAAQLDKKLATAQKRAMGREVKAR
jgi:hypothetical protein